MTDDEQTTGGDEPTLKALQERARELDVDGRSTMDREALVDAIERAEAIAAMRERATQTDRELAAGALAAAADDDGSPSSVALEAADTLIATAEQRATRREETMRVIGSPTTTTQED